MAMHSTEMNMTSLGVGMVGGADDRDSFHTPSQWTLLKSNVASDAQDDDD